MKSATSLLFTSADFYVGVYVATFAAGTLQALAPIILRWPVFGAAVLSHWFFSARQNRQQTRSAHSALTFLWQRSESGEAFLDASFGLPRPTKIFGYNLKDRPADCAIKALRKICGSPWNRAKPIKKITAPNKSLKWDRLRH